VVDVAGREAHNVAESRVLQGLGKCHHPVLWATPANPQEGGILRAEDCYLRRRDHGEEGLAHVLGRLNVPLEGITMFAVFVYFVLGALCGAGWMRRRAATTAQLDNASRLFWECPECHVKGSALDVAGLEYLWSVHDQVCDCTRVWSLST
jgi:hypothetical protein